MSEKRYTVCEENDRLRAERDEWKAKAEANAALFDAEHAAYLKADEAREKAEKRAKAHAAAAHALEVIERDDLGVDRYPDGTWRLFPRERKNQAFGLGPTIIAAVADYEQRKRGRA